MPLGFKQAWSSVIRFWYFSCSVWFCDPSGSGGGFGSFGHFKITGCNRAFWHLWISSSSLVVTAHAWLCEFNGINITEGFKKYESFGRHDLGSKPTVNTSLLVLILLLVVGETWYMALIDTYKSKITKIMYVPTFLVPFNLNIFPRAMIKSKTEVK